MELTKYYKEWFSIPLSECPPSDSRLLNLPPNASLVDIQRSSEPIVALLTGQISGEHAAAAVELLKQVVAARGRLSDAAAKAGYRQTSPSGRSHQLDDAHPPASSSLPRATASPAGGKAANKGRASNESKTAAPMKPVLAVALPGTVPAQQSEVASIPVISTSDSTTGHTPPALLAMPSSQQDSIDENRRSRRTKKMNPVVEFLKIAAGGLAGILIAGMILGYGFGVGPLGPAKPKPKVVADDSAKPPTPGVQRPQVGPERTQSQPSNPRPANPSNVIAPSSPNTIVLQPSIDVQPTYPLHPSDFEDLVVTAPQFVFTPASASVSVPSPSTVSKPPRSISQPPNTAAASPTPLRDRRLPVPPDADLARARAMISNVYREQIASASTPKDYQSLARIFQSKSKDVANRGAVQYALLEESAIAAGQGHDIVLAWTALDQLSSVFQCNVLKKRETALRKCTEVVKTTKEFELVSEYWIKLFDEAMQLDNIEAAGRFVSEAERAASRSQNARLQQFVRNGSRVYDEIEQAYQDAQSSREKYIADPDDDKAAADWGQYLCTYKNDWEQGLPLLARGTNEFATTARRDISSATSAAEQLAIGDQWYDLGADKRKVAQRYLMNRAASWYEKSFKKLRGFNKVKVSRKLIDIREDQLDSFARSVQLLPIATSSSSRWKWNDDRIEISDSYSSYPLRFTVESDSTYELRGNIALAKWTSPFSLNVPVGNNHRLFVAIAPPGGQSWLGSDRAAVAQVITNSEVFVPNRENRFVLQVIAVGPGEAAVLVRANDKLLMSWTGSIDVLPTNRTSTKSSIRTSRSGYAEGIEFTAGSNNSLYLRNWELRMLSSQLKRTR